MYRGYLIQFKRLHREITIRNAHSITQWDMNRRYLDEQALYIEKTKELVQLILMYVDKKRISLAFMHEMKQKYTVPSARDQINQYVTPVGYTTEQSQERGGEMNSALNLSFGKD